MLHIAVTGLDSCSHPAHMDPLVEIAVGLALGLVRVLQVVHYNHYKGLAARG